MAQGRADAAKHGKGSEMHGKEWYESTLRDWMSGVEGLWNDRRGRYESGGAAAPYWDTKLIVPLSVFALQGEEWAQRRVQAIVRSMCQSPPWDESERLWNNSYERKGLPPHGANSPIDSGLSFALRHAPEIGLDSRDVQTIRHRITRSLERWSESGEGAEKFDRQVFLDREGRQMDLSAAWKKAQEGGAPMDLSFVRERGPANQVCFQMRAALHAYRATGDAVFLDDLDRLWNRVLPGGGRCGGDGFMPYPAIFDEDWSFRYSSTPLHNYEMSVYDLPMLGMFADVIRTLRELGRVNRSRESFFSRWSHAALTRAELLDGSTNMVLDLYGPDRIAPNENYGQSGVWLHPLVSVADLTPLPREELKYFFDAGIERFKRWGFIKCSPDIGLPGWRESSGLEDMSWMAYEVALMLLSNPAILAVESARPNRCTTGFAWKEKHFVRQTPTYHLTVVGTSPGFDGKWGIPCSGGEYVLRVPHGDYLVPPSDRGRPSLEAQAGDVRLASKEATVANEASHSFEMTASAPAFGDAKKVQAYDMPLCDVSSEGVEATVELSHPGLSQRRAFACSRERIVITDTLVAGRDITVDLACTRIPIMTKNPRGEASRLTGLFDAFGKHGSAARLHAGEGFGFRFLHYGLELTQLSERETLLRIGEEWNEGLLVNCWLRMVDCLWVSQPTLLRAGESVRFQYELLPHSDGHVL